MNDPTGLTYYHFLPVLRQGVAAHINSRPADSSRVVLQVGINVSGQQKDAAGQTTDRTVNKQIELIGPGDVVGIDSRVVSRTNPMPGVMDFEYNYFPSIDFAVPDFPWCLSPEPISRNQLTPWITLIVLSAEERDDKVHKEFEDGDLNLTNQVPWIKIKKSTPLPNLEEAWRWAHVQVTSDANISLKSSDVKSIIEKNPECVVSRLVCARKLQAGVLYRAFVVPTFKLGLWPLVAAGKATIGTSILEKSSEKPPPPDSTISLPYYYCWEFRTSELGDFEQQLRALQPVKLTHIGLCRVDWTKPGYYLEPPGGEANLQAEGALQSNDIKCSQWGMDKPEGDASPNGFREGLAGILGKACTLESPQKVPFEGAEGITDVRVDLTASKTLEGFIVGNFSWNTMQPTASNIECQRSTRDGTRIRSSANSNELRTDHSIPIDHLIPETKYQFRITATADGLFFTVDGEFMTAELPTIVPPAYGRWYRGTNGSVNYPGESWYDELNLDPRHRLVAGLGAQSIQAQQETLMKSAWQQLGQIREANKLIELAQFGLAVSGKVYERLDRLRPEDFLQLTRPLHSRVMDSQAQLTIESTMAGNSLLATALGPSFRRVNRATGPIRRRQKRQWGTTSAAHPNGSIHQRLGALNIIATGEHPTPQGMATLASLLPQTLQNKMTARELKGALRSQPFLGLSSQNPIHSIGDYAVSALNFWLDLGKATHSNPKPIDLPAKCTDLKPALKPEKTIVARLRARIPMLKDGRPIPFTFAPKFARPMYEWLSDRTQGYLLPGLESIPQNSIGVLTANQRFIESFLCGCNHEFAAELIWREYPVDLKGTFFEQFWDVSGLDPSASKRHDIESIQNWSNKRLGKHQLVNDEPLVLVFKGDLLRRYPTAVIYAVESVARPPGSNQYVPALPEYFPEDPKPTLPNRLDPVFGGGISPDIRFIGFPFNIAEARGDVGKPGLYFVIEERVSEARFGLDVPTEKVLSSWNDLSWSHLTISDGEYIDKKSPTSTPDDKWGKSSATMARITLQRPVRIAIHASQLLPNG